MAFHNKTHQEALSEINVTPLVDVMLVLLVVFIVTAPLLTPSVKVNLPKTVATEVSQQNHLLTISVDSEGTLYSNAEKIKLDTLGTVLAEKLAHDPELAIQLNADDHVQYGYVAAIMAVIQKSGISRVFFQTKPI